MRNNILFLLVGLFSLNSILPAFAQEKGGSLPPKAAPAQPPKPDEEAPAKADPEKTPKPGETAANPADKKPKIPSDTPDPHAGLFKAIFTDDADQLDLTKVLWPLTVFRLIQLNTLRQSIPAMRRMWHEVTTFRTFNRVELARAEAALKAWKELKANAPSQTHNLEKAADAYGERIHQVEVLGRELGELPQIKNDLATKERLAEAMKAWTQRGDMVPLNAFIQSERTRRLRFKEGQGWLSKFDTWKTQERVDAQAVADAHNTVIDVLNKGLLPADHKQKLRVHDNQNNHSPGDFFYHNNNSIKHTEIVQGTKDTCLNAWKQLKDRQLDLSAKKGKVASIGQVMTLGMPFWTVGLSGTVFWFHYNAYAKTWKKYGKAPEEVRAEVTLKATIENEVNVRAEAGLDAQVAKREAEFGPFIDVAVDQLVEYSGEIIAALEEYQKLNLDVPIDVARKKTLFADRKQLRKHVLQAIPYAGQRLAKDINASQILSLLALATKPETMKDAEETHKRFLYALYERILDNALPEVESSVEVDKNLITMGAGQHMTKLVRGQIVPETLPKMHKMKITEPANVAPLPILPEKKKEPAQGGVVPPQALMPDGLKTKSDVGSLPGKPGTSEVVAVRPGIDVVVSNPGTSLSGIPVGMPGMGNK